MRNFSLFLLLLISTFSFGQITADDVKYYIGEGQNTAYLVVDFKDNTDDRSYVWGVRFDENNPINGIEMLELLAAEEPNFSFEQSGGFLDQIAFNSHDSYEQPYDYWSLWTSMDGNDWNMAGWMTSDLIDGMWFGASYGFGMEVPGPSAPITPIPAYSSQWLDHALITNWIGAGSNESLIVIDFGTTENAIEQSFVFGIKYTGSINAPQALDLIAAEFPTFNYSLSNSNIHEITVGAHQLTNAVSTFYTGTDLSNWATASAFDSISLNDNQWLGISFGNRRPFMPQDGNSLLGTSEINMIKFSAYPNPTSNYINVEIDEELINVSIYNLLGRKLFSTNRNSIDISQLSTGTYILEVTSSTGKGVKKILKN